MYWTIRTLKWGVTVLVATCILNPPSLFGNSQLSIPRPTDALLPPPPSPTLEPSVVNLTIGTTLAQLREAVESSIPVHHQHEGQWLPGKTLLDGTHFEYQYYLWRGPVQFRTEGTRLLTVFPDVRYRVQVRVKDTDGKTRIGACGYGSEWPVHLSLKAASDITWNDRWMVQTSTKFESPQVVEPCRLTPLDHDATGLVIDRLKERLPTLALAIDRTFLAQVEAKKRAQIIWEQLQYPMEVGIDTWLVAHPTEPRAGTLILDGDRSVHTMVSMVMNPTIVLGRKPTVVTHPLPPLQQGPAGREGFHLAVPLLVSYDELTERLAPEIIGQEIIPPVGSTITITGLKIYGSEDKLICEVTVSGGVNGKLYLQGKPTLDPQGQTLEFAQFDFTVDTSNVLVTSTSRMMHNSIREKVLPDTKIDLSDRITALRARVERQLNRRLAPHIWLEGAVTDLHPTGIYPVAGGIEMQFVLDGTMHLTLQ